MASSYNVKKYLPLIAFALKSSLGFCTELTVCGDCRYTTIKQAVASAPPHSKIIIKSGIYRENNIILQKPLRLVGEASSGKMPIIDGEGTGNVFFVTGEGIEISELEIRNSGESDIEDFAGVKVMDAGQCRIVGNVLVENIFGIYLGRSHGCLIENNHVRSRMVRGAPAGDGIHVWYGENIVILNNHVEDNRDGIYFEFVKNSRIFRNHSKGNFRYGLHFMFSNNNEYRDNVFENNGSGVAVMYSHNINMTNNRFEKSLGSASYGILLKDISNSEVSSNVFSENTVGVFFDGTTRSSFTGNVFKSNGWAMRVLGNTDSNVFERNNFIGNSFEISTNARTSMNKFDSNYWSGYNGVDLNRDGIGDNVYYPMRLSVLLMEQYSVSILLLKSFFFSILDQAENAFPVLTPETFRDDHPRMRPLEVPHD